MTNQKRLKFTEEEIERRRELGLPLTKQLRFMERLPDFTYKEILVDNYDYEIVDTYLPSGTKSIMVTLENGTKQRLLLPFFIHMQRPSFVEDMEQMAREID